MKVTRMSAPLGVIIDELDVRNVDTSKAQELDALFYKSGLTPTEHMRFAQHWHSDVSH